MSVENPRGEGEAIALDVRVSNLAGHKLPPAYPSRRAWLRVRDAAGRTVFESGAVRPDGSIAENDKDLAADRWQPHHDVIREAGQVQVYESVMEHHSGGPTTGLLSAVTYLKDNRLLPRGFDRNAGGPDVAVRGEAETDVDFVGGADRVRFMVDAGGATGELEVVAELWYQPVGFRWAQNLSLYDAPETRRFVAWFDAMPESSALRLAEGNAHLP